MRFPQHWAKASSDFTDASGTRRAVSCWQWSDVSLAEAEEHARNAAQTLVERVQRGEELRRSRDYGYPDRPLREPILRRVEDARGELSAVVTRNAAGCEVLNTARAMFIDVDVPGIDGPSLFGKLRVLLGGAVREDPIVGRARRWLADKPSWGFRVYRTRAGFRLLATHAPIDPASPETQAVFDALGADPLYVKLCKTQQCYRARLTPKPWRIDIDAPKTRWPFADAEAAATFTTWERAYGDKAGQFVTCALVTTLGSPRVHADVAPIVRLHDEATRVGANLPLA